MTATPKNISKITKKHESNLHKMNAETLKELSDVLEKLTHSGDPSLDQTLMKRVKTLCKSSNLIVRAAFEQTVKHMSKDHCEVRLSAFQVCDELFQRSHAFREMAVDNFHTIVTLVCGVESLKPLPPPKQVAERLKKESLLAIRNWMEKFGSGYPKLKLGFQYLKFNKKVDFDSLIAANEAELRQAQDRERRNKAFIEQRIKEITMDYREQLPEIRMCIKEMESCFQILMPPMFEPEPQTMSSTRMNESPFIRFESTSSTSIEVSNGMDEEVESDNEGAESDIDDTTVSMNRNQSDTSDSEVEWEDVEPNTGTEAGAHGMIGTGWNLSLEIPDTLQVVQGVDNESLVEILREKYKLLTGKYLKNIGKWIEWFAKGDRETLLKEVIDIKERVMATIDKYNELNIVTEDNPEEVLVTDDHHDDDVISKSLLSPTRADSGLFSSHEGNLGRVKYEMIQDPTTPQAQLLAVKHSTTSSGKSTEERMMSSRDKGGVVPAVPFDVDLINWGNLKGPSPTVNSISSLNQFWCEDKDVTISEDHKNSLKCRVISFPGEFKPITRSCRAPMTNGKLCVRKDRLKCPFHGIIVPRDEFGNPVTPLPDNGASSRVNDGTTGTISNETGTVIDGTGTVCSRTDTDTDQDKKKSKRKTRKSKVIKHPGLTNLKKFKDTPKSRVEGKLLNKRTLKRIGKQMDNFDCKLRRDKFSDNFNYALKQ